MRSVQFAPQARRSDGQTTAFVGVGLVPGSIRDRCNGRQVLGRTVVGSGTGVSTGIVRVTSGVRVTGDVTTGAAEGNILKVPDT